MSNRASPLAAAFIWALCAVASYGAIDLVTHKKAPQISNDLSAAVPLAAVVAYSERKLALKP